MLERASALAHLPVETAPGAFVALREARPLSILQVAAWPDSLARVQGVTSAIIGLAVPRLGSASAGPDATLAALAPGRFLIAGSAPDLVTRFEAALDREDAALTDLSHGRVILHLEGAAAAALLTKVVSLDLSLPTFPPSRFAQTMIHHIDVFLHRRGEESFEIWVLRSFAESLAEWLLDAGLEFGLAPRPD